MIVKNEAHVIERCLTSLRGFVDYWVIVDTGSSDGTQQRIRELMSDVPGELIERPWVDFAHNRTEALECARGKADYIFTLDADEVFVRKPGFKIPPLDKDAFLVEMISGGVSYYKTQLITNRLQWCYKGVLHEYLHCSEQATEGILQDATTYRYTDGARSRDKLTYKKDALVLERALLDEPENTRYVFYLAQSYRDAQEFELAIKHYERRAAMGGWPEEVWYSLYQVAEIKQRLEKPWPEILDAYLAAFEYYPKRREPLFKAAMRYQKDRKYNSSHLLLARCLDIPFPADDRLFVERVLYDYMAALEYAVSCYWVGDQAEAIRVNNDLLNVAGLPGAIFDRVLKNRRFSLDAIHPKKKTSVTKLNRIKVCVTFRDPGTFFDNCIESLLTQDYGCCEMVFIDEGSHDDSASRVPIEDPRVTLIQNETPRGAEALQQFLSEHCAPRDIVVYLSGSDWLAHRGVLTAINDFYERRDCWLMYGQYRYSTGNYGFALPFPDRESFNDPAREWYWPDIRTHRAGLFFKVRDQYPDVLKDCGGDALMDVLMDAAGYDHACFNDEVLYIRNAECAPEIDPGGNPVRKRHPRLRPSIQQLENCF